MIIFRIKEVRNKKGVSLKTLSKKTKISRGYLFDLENNRKSNPSIQILFDIAEALNVNIKDLFYTKFDIEDLKLKLYESINNNGLNAENTLEISRLIDLLINIKMKEELDN